MKNNFLNLVSITISLSALSNTAYSQSLYNNGAAISIKSGGTLTVTGDMINTASASIENSGTVSVAGNSTNNGTFTSLASGTFHLTGNTTQFLSGSTALNAKDVIVNNAAGIILTTPLNIDGAITFTNGIITATNPAAPVSFSSNSSVNGVPTDASHINGYVQKNGTGSFTFPIGDATKYQPVGVNLTTNTAGITARYYAGDAGTGTFGTTGGSATPLVAYNAREYWDIFPGATAMGTVTIHYDSYNNVGITNTTDLRVAHKTGGQWLNEGGTLSGNASNGTLISTNIMNWSPFTLGSVSAGSPLPLKLVSFTGFRTGTTNRIDWETSAEEAGTTFTIERSSNGKDYKAIGIQKGNGDNSVYTFSDNTPPAIAYYKILMTAADGTNSYSSVLVLRATVQNEDQVALYPVPFKANLSIKSTAESLIGTTAVLKDVTGKTIFSITLQSGINTCETEELPSGLYTLHFADGSIIKIIKE